MCKSHCRISATKASIVPPYLAQGHQWIYVSVVRGVKRAAQEAKKAFVGVIVTKLA